MNLVRTFAAASTLLVMFAIAPAIARAAMQPPAAAAKFEKPAARTVSGGQCRLDDKKTTFAAAFPGQLDRGAAIARQQQTKSFELRAALSLSRLWKRQGKIEAARQLLAEVYDKFSEGFTMPDLRRAQVLLAQLDH